MRMTFRTFSAGGMFTGVSSALNDASQQAAEFASQLEPEQVVSISQTSPQPNVAYVTVWYWQSNPDQT